MAFALPSRAYDLQMLDCPTDRARDHGWVYGMPPGISTEQWPLDAVTGYALMHGFTLELPDDYRVHGEDIVAVSFFATAPDHNDGGAIDDPEIREAVAARPSHPRLSRMIDILDYEYAAILLSKRNMTAHSQCQRLRLRLRPLSGHAGSRSAAPAPFTNPRPAMKKLLPSMPRADLAENRAIVVTDRASDPNAGKGPQDTHVKQEAADRISALLLLCRWRREPR